MASSDDVQTAFVAKTAPVSPPSSQPSGPALAFAPGQIIAGRYRIAGLLGRGGMGEVYRADDLKLGTPVALKFLPREVERDADMLERFHAEVRTARQVSHPHVCRVYDIAEVDGRHFLSMEYVDGEDLAILLRRIGRLPPAKAIEIARQLCAALAAAHDKGVLHRDLKPANVMIDGFGRARVTDFGLAVAAGDASAEVAGTPAYMSPEQLAGQTATVQSDIYALGLVLYELFTGKRPFDAATVADWRQVHSQSQPPSPHLITADMDPTVERVILRCLAKEPSSRPASASQVALALPGGDPLAAAIAAGETPSPGMVAAAGGEGALSPARAWLWLAITCLTVTGIWFISPASTDYGLAPMENSPEVLRDRTRSMIEHLGYPIRVADDASWLWRNYEVIRWQADHMKSVEWRRRLATVGTPVLLHYRQSAEALSPQNRDNVVTATDPIPGQPGDIYAVVDGRAHLRALRVASPERLTLTDPGAPFPEAAVFELTGLDPTRFQPVTAEWVPSVAFSDRREWTGTSAEIPEIPIRLSAATLNGKLVAVATRGPWDLQKIDFVKHSKTAQIGRVSVALVALAVSVGGIFVARRNLRLSRGDTVGASRLAALVFGLVLTSYVAQAHLNPDWFTTIFAQLAPAVGSAVVQALLVWALYLALEPAIRQRMPELLVGWVRLLEGRWRDPRVGHDVLIGIALGSVIAAVIHLANGLPTFVPLAAQTPIPQLNVGNRIAPLAALLSVPLVAIFRGVLQMAMLFGLRTIIARKWIDVIVLALAFSVFAFGAENPWLEVPGALVMGSLFAVATVFGGLLTLVSTWAAFMLLSVMPVGYGFSQWFGPYVWTTLVLLVTVTVGAFVLSLGGRPAFGAVRPSAS